MRNRLIELLKTSNKAAILRKENPHFVTEETDEESIIADYLIKNGVILPPCKVGDTVYVVSMGYIDIYNIVSVSSYKSKYQNLSSFVAEHYEDNERKIGFEEKNINKYVFLSKEEAEKALKGGCDHE